MTYLERFKGEHPDLDEEYIVEMYCPTDGLVSMMCPSDAKGNRMECEECWHREVPDEDITVAEPVYDPDMPAGLTVDGPDRT